MRRCQAEKKIGSIREWRITFCAAVPGVVCKIYQDKVQESMKEEEGDVTVKSLETGEKKRVP